MCPKGLAPRSLVEDFDLEMETRPPGTPGPAEQLDRAAVAPQGLASLPPEVFPHIFAFGNRSSIPGTHQAPTLPLCLSTPCMCFTAAAAPTASSDLGQGVPDLAGSPAWARSGLVQHRNRGPRSFLPPGRRVECGGALAGDLPAGNHGLGVRGKSDLEVFQRRHSCLSILLSW